MDDNLNSKILSGLERISEVFKSMLWEKAKQHGLSPIQIQILVFLSNHTSNLCTVSHLALEFNLTKPTISDAVRVLHYKGLVDKNITTSDSRSYSLSVSTKGNRLLKSLLDYTDPMNRELRRLDSTSREQLFKTLTVLIHNLNKSGILAVQRTCFGCKYYQSGKSSHFCNLLKQPLLDREIRLDCPEFEPN